jgi:hypothetical protein
MSHHGHEQETGLRGKVNELKQELHHTTKDDAHEVEVKRTPTGKAIYTESVAPVPKETLPEHIQFPDIMTPEQHLERAKYYRDEAEKWRSKHYGHDDGLNAKKYNDLMGKAHYHEGMAAQPEGLTVPKEHPNPLLPNAAKLESGPRVYKGKGTGQVLGTGAQAQI